MSIVSIVSSNPASSHFLSFSAWPSKTPFELIGISAKQPDMSQCDRVFGPRVSSSCRAFDFTLYFEDVFFAIVPNVAFLLLVPAAVYHLLRSQNVVKRSKLLFSKAASISTSLLLFSSRCRHWVLTLVPGCLPRIDLMPNCLSRLETLELIRLDSGIAGSRYPRPSHCHRGRHLLMAASPTLYEAIDLTRCLPRSCDRGQRSSSPHALVGPTG